MTRLLTPVAVALLVFAGLIGYSTTARQTPEPPLTHIALGSCNKQYEPQPLWSTILSHNPDLWIWLGDNVYADTKDMDAMRATYAQQQQNKGYQQLTATTPVIGTWDDHDYGANDAGRFYPKRDSSQQLFLDFLGVPDDDPRRLRRGVYSAHTYGPPGQRVKVILLDTRYHRDSLTRVNTDSALYRPNPDGDILGDAQWTWLEDELRTSDAQIHLIGTSIQAIPTQHRWEKWANFPQARDRLFALIDRTDAPGVVLLSGDRHKSELSRYDESGTYPLYELTASGMTHVAPSDGSEGNRHRVGPLIIQKNFGLLHLDWSADPVQIQFQVRGTEDQILIDHTVSLAELQPEG
jgi:alkaline phosphatase D